MTARGASVALTNVTSSITGLHSEGAKHKNTRAVRFLPGPQDHSRLQADGTRSISQAAVRVRFETHPQEQQLSAEP
ncbi:hypothetical protein DENSPDRAFT_276402 [Dentipellis sp. KUC8613]|nr:hypothetical protein DENSPDRAFT_276402 [Dentipellis sp. KUC8613]